MRDTERDRDSFSDRLGAQSDIRTLSGAPRTQIGPYQLIAKIGEGGMGTVWLTKLPGPAGFNKLAVVKELRAELSHSPAFVEMFLNEARLAARLTHPNVVHTYGANEDQGRLYIAMEYLDGQPWSAVRHVLWSNRSLPLALHLKVLADTLSGLHYAHELCDYDGAPLQVVHRDMSPQNVFVTYDGQVKVVDFGVARAVTSHTPITSGTPMFVGKVAYSGPEQLRGDPVDRRADVFAVGVMLWEACAGKRLMEGQDRSEAVRTRASEPAPRIREVVSSMPRALSDICDRAIALNPADRFATAAEFRDAIVNYLDVTTPDIDQAQLGQLVASAFRDERTRINSLIERSLMQRASPGRPSQAAAPPTDHLIDTLRPPPGPVEHTIRADLSELASVSKLETDDDVLEASISVAARTSDARRPRQIAAIAGLVALALVAFIGWRVAKPASYNVTAIPLPPLPPAESKSPKPAESATTPSTTRRASAPTDTPRRVRLQITASPPHASLFMDGTPLSNPYAGELQADGELHLIRVSAPGLQTQERVIELDGDKALELALVPIVRRAGARREPTAQRASPAKPGLSEESPKAAQPNDDPDFDTRITKDAKARPIYEEDPY
jgi:serine/threonine-protein kinase